MINQPRILDGDGLSTVTSQSPLRELYFRWQEVKDEFVALPDDCDEEAEEPIFSEMLRLEQQAADFEPRTMEDLIFKIIFASDDGEMDVSIYQQALVAQAYALAGIEPRFKKEKQA